MQDVRRADRGDVRTISKVLARAFRDDPVARFVFGDRARQQRELEVFFVVQLRHAYLPRGEVFTTEARNAAALWIPPDATPLSLFDSLAHMRLIPLLGRRIFLTQRVAAFLGARHPRERHYYLGTIGTDPSVQRQGIASALLQPVLERCDLERLPAYLECSREENVAFYKEQGFSVTDVVRLGRDGPSLWLMWRRPF